MNELCAKKGIKREFSMARTLLQNGDAKRKNRTLIEAARTMLADLLLPLSNLGSGVKHLSISFMRSWGCLDILKTLDPLGKFDGKSDEGYLLGYSTTSKAFRLLVDATSQAFEEGKVEGLRLSYTNKLNTGRPSVSTSNSPLVYGWGSGCQHLVLLGLVCAAQKNFMMEMMFRLSKKMLLGLVLEAINGKIWLCQGDSRGKRYCGAELPLLLLEKSEGNSNFHEIVDFLASSLIHHALTARVEAGRGWKVQKNPELNPHPLYSTSTGGDQHLKPSLALATTQDSKDSLEETNGNEGDQVQTPHDSPLSGGHTSDRSEEISALKYRIKKLEKKCKPSISHHRAWLKSVKRLSMKKRFGKESIMVWSTWERRKRGRDEGSKDAEIARSSSRLQAKVDKGKTGGKKKHLTAAIARCMYEVKQGLMLMHLVCSPSFNRMKGEEYYN
ncbi:ribonuclease H-like domain, reverse transcriptase, RNA-dependent DNA polymerase [Tanacetum coccineum]